MASVEVWDVCERGGQEIDGLKKVKVPLERGKEPIRR